MKFVKIILLGLCLSIISYAQINQNNFLQFKARIGFEDEKERIVAKRFSEDGTRLTLVGLKTIQTWDVASAKLIESHPHEIVRLDKLFGTYYEFSPDGKKIITLDVFRLSPQGKLLLNFRSNAFVVRDLKTGTILQTIERKQDKNLMDVAKENVDWDIKDRYALTTGEDHKSILIWEINEG
jgi:WD40 repeat protein